MQQHVAGVELFGEAHDGHTGAHFAAQDRPLDRCRAAILRQQRGVNVDAAEAWQIQDRTRQNPPVGGDDDQVGRPGAQLIEKLGRSDLERLQNWDPSLDRGQLHRRRLQLLSATGGSIGLADDTDDGIGAGDQDPQRRHREFGRAEEDDAKGVSHEGAYSTTRPIAEPAGECARPKRKVRPAVLGRPAGGVSV